MFVAHLLLGLAAAAVQEQPAEPAPSSEAGPRPGEISRSEAEATLANCGVRRFQSSAESLIDGKMRRTTIRLCAADSESSAEWLAKLEKSAAQVEAQPRLPENVKVKLLADLRAEIARIGDTRPASASAAAASLTETTESLASVAKPIPSGDKLPESLPPLPPRPAAGVATAPAASAALATATPVPLVRKPRIRALCLPPGGAGGGVPCDSMNRDTIMAIRADEDIAGEVGLRFRQQGSDREAEVLLARSGLRRGQSVRLRVPQAVCRGKVRAEFDIQVLKAGIVADTLGPFNTRC